jgi:hypothetical protein
MSMAYRTLFLALLVLPVGCVDRVLVEGAEGEGAEADVPDEEDPDAPQSGDACEEDSDCAAGSVCFEGTCVEGGDVRVSLSWTVVSDFDLHVRTPDGVEVYFGNPIDGGGELDVDDCVGQSCRDPGGVHVENIFFETTAPRGQYTVWVQNYDGAQAGAWNIEVAGAVSASWSGELPAAEFESSATMSFVWP